MLVSKYFAIRRWYKNFCTSSIYPLKVDLFYYQEPVVFVLAYLSFYCIVYRSIIRIMASFLMGLGI